MKKVSTFILVVCVGGAVLVALRVRSAPVALDPPAQQPAIPWIRPDPNAFSAAEPNQTAFDLTYRGLSGAKDELFSQGFWGFGSGPPEGDPPFIKALTDKGIGPLHLVYNPYLKGADWSAVELRRGRPVAFYLDLNADGKVTSNERMLPAPADTKDSVDFLTPDFCLTPREGSRVPFRVLLRVRRDASDINCMWAPACVLQGESPFHGQATRLVLFPNGPTGTFDGFGRSRLALASGQERMGDAAHALSSLMLHQEQFYQVQVRSRLDRGAVRVVLAKDVSPRGKLVATVACDNDPGAEIASAAIEGRNTPVFLALQKGEQELPAGPYRLSYGSVTYGVGESSWQCDFKRGPDFDVAESQEAKVRLGQPRLTVRAIPEDKRYEQDVQCQSVYTRGTKIYITREVQGLAGEAYGRFSKKGDKTWYQDVQPQIRITDPNGAEVISKAMEYG